MKTRETFDEIRKGKKEYLTLRVRMVLAVQLELIASGLLTLVLDILIRKVFPWWKFPIVWELIIVSFIIGSIATAFVSKKFFYPMKKLRQAMDSIADGDFSVRLETSDTNLGEVKTVYAGFNLMAHELNSTEVLQSDFISNVSHEFKTPINAIEGYVTLLQDIERLTEEERREYIDKILFNTKRLSGLVGNILLLSKIDSQTAIAHKKVYRLDEQIRQSILMLESEWTKKDIEFDVEMDEVEYNGFENLLQHVWYNLISNAVKFNPVGGMICIKLSEKNNNVVFTVSDNGPGIAEEDKKKIFDKFYQSDTSHKQEGNGLGLALVKKIIDLEDGEVYVENVKGGGCRFTVELTNTDQGF